jgi:hypothetical protein
MEEALDTDKSERNSTNHNHINDMPNNDAESGTPCGDTVGADKKAQAREQSGLWRGERRSH